MLDLYIYAAANMFAMPNCARASQRKCTIYFCGRMCGRKITSFDYMRAHEEMVFNRDVEAKANNNQ